VCLVATYGNRAPQGMGGERLQIGDQSRPMQMAGE
jgi:hypothetical protein